MTLHHNPYAQSILARAPRIICDGDCGRQRILYLYGQEPVQADLTEPGRGWTLEFIGNVDGGVTRDDRCPDCAGKESA